MWDVGRGIWTLAPGSWSLGSGILYYPRTEGLKWKVKDKVYTTFNRPTTGKRFLYFGNVETVLSHSGRILVKWVSDGTLNEYDLGDVHGTAEAAWAWAYTHDITPDVGKGGKGKKQAHWGPAEAEWSKNARFRNRPEQPEVVSSDSDCDSDSDTMPPAKKPKASLPQQGTKPGLGQYVGRVRKPVVAFRS